jgi:hypothetical protein
MLMAQYHSARWKLLHSSVSAPNSNYAVISSSFRATIALFDRVLHVIHVLQLLILPDDPGHEY